MTICIVIADMKIKSVFISLFNAYPPTSGAASVTFNVAKYSNGNRVLLQIGHEDKNENIDDEFIVVTVKGLDDGKWKKLLGIFGVIKRMTDKVIGFAPEVVVLEGASWVLYLLLLARYIKKRYPAARIIYHAHNVECVLRKQKHCWPIVMITKWAEGWLFRKSDVSTVVSSVDRAQVERLYGVSPKLLPNGVDVSRFDAVTPAQIDAVRNKYGIDKNTILFMGFYLYKPNMEAIDFLVKDVMPKVISKCPATKLVIIGSEIPYHQPWLINPGVIEYDELPAFVMACGIGVAPIFSGSGTRLKILEYMAASIPVVATTKGAEGLKINRGYDLFIHEGPYDFVKQIANLLSDKVTSNSIGINGYNVVSKYYSWENIVLNLNKIIDNYLITTIDLVRSTKNK